MGVGESTVGATGVVGTEGGNVDGGGMDSGSRGVVIRWSRGTGMCVVPAGSFWSPSEVICVSTVGLVM